jgi:DNA-binding NarL/FixJ family response regulator
VVSDGEHRLDVAACIEAGASGVVSTGRSTDNMVAAVRQAVAGRRVITPRDEADLLVELREHRRTTEKRLNQFATLSARESDVLGAMMQGMSAAAIAERSYVSVATIRSQIKAILRKLGVNSQLAAVAMAYRAGWTPEDNQRLHGRNPSAYRASSAATSSI